MIFKTYKMEDALESLIDYRGKTPQKSDSGIMTLSAKSVRDGYIDYAQCYYISEDEYNRFMVRGFPKIGDVLLTTEAPLGVTARLDRDDVALAQRLLTIRGKEDVLDTGYLYYYLRSSVGQAKLKERQTGTTVTGIKQAEFRKIEIEIPDIAEQKKIATILGDIDCKIHNNKGINENLSDQIQAIYSNEFDPTTHMPSGVLADICSYSSDRIPVSELSISTYFSTENMQPNKMGSVDATSLPAITQTTGCHKGDVLVSNIRPYFKKIVYVTDDRCGCSTDVLCFVPKEDQYSAFLFGTLYMDRFFDYMVAGSKGTKMPRGDKQQIMNYPVVVPDKESLDLFNGLIVPMLDQIATNRSESSRLAALRDALLPKLMSGELDVSDLAV